MPPDPGSSNRSSASRPSTNSTKRACLSRGVSWGWPNERVLRRIRALAPMPGLALDLEGLEMFVTRAAPASSFPSALEPGEAAVVGTPPALVLRTGDGAVAVERAVLPSQSDGPDTVLGRGELGRTVEKHLAGRNAARVG